MTRLRSRHSDVPSLGARAFTLIELLTVIAVIAILLAIVLLAGRGVLVGQQAKLTQNALMSLDRALDEYITSVGTPPTYNPDDYKKVPGDDNGPQAYGSGQNNMHCARPDAAVFLEQARGFGLVDQIIAGMPDRFLRVTRTDPAPPADTDSPEERNAKSTVPSVVDAWGEPDWPSEAGDDPYPVERQQVIYYVHPQNTLAQDLYGRCVNGRPYFMSAGPDKLYGLTNEPMRPGVDVEVAESFTKDNIYSYPVGPIKTGMSTRDWNPQ